MFIKKIYLLLLLFYFLLLGHNTGCSVIVWRYMHSYMHFFHLEGFFFHLCHSFDFVLTLCVSVWKRCALRPWLMRCRSWRRCRKIQELWCMGRGEGRSSWIHNKTEQAKTADQQGSPPSVNDPTGCSPGSGLILSPLPLTGDTSV